MPNRILRESIRSSETLDQLSPEAEVLFYRLLTCADDFGRFLADPRMVLASAFPLRVATLDLEKVERLLQELHAADLVEIYRVGERRFAQFVTFDEHNSKRAKNPKYPAPSEGEPETCTHVQADANTCEQMHSDACRCAPIREARSETREARHEKREARSESAKPARKRAERAQEHPGFDEFWAAYPRKVSKQQAAKAWHREKPPLPEVLAAVEVQSRSEQWAEEGGKYIPHPSTWLNRKQWEDDPDAYGRTTASDSKPQTGVDDAIRELLGEAGPGFGAGPPIGGGLPQGDIDGGEPEGVRGGLGRLGDRVLDPGNVRPAEVLEVLPEHPGDPREGPRNREIRTTHPPGAT